MKKVVALIIFVLTYSITNAQWVWQNPLPQGNMLYSVKFISPTVGFAVGEIGTILKTTDAGISWQIQDSGTTDGLSGISFADLNNGCVFGGSTILRTTDGGKSWIKYSIGLKGSLTSLCFIDKNIGTAVGGWGDSNQTVGFMLRTTNGGITWQQQIKGTTALLNSIAFTDANNGIAVGEGSTILITKDGGLTWNQIKGNGGSRFQSVFFIDANNGIIVGDWMTILRTPDGGNSWYGVNLGSDLDMRWLYKVCFSNSQNGIAVGQGVICRTTDGGNSWQKQSSPLTLIDVAFAGSNNGIATDEKGRIQSTSDGGATWQLGANSYSETNLSVSFIDQNYGAVVGVNGTILMTTNGGNTWLPKTSGTKKNLSNIYLRDAKTGMAVGNEGIILKTTDGGTTWLKLVSGTTTNLMGVVCTYENTWIAVSYSGSILRTEDGGINWSIQSTNPSNYLYGITFINKNIGYVFGSYLDPSSVLSKGIILKTTNGGITWTTQQSGADLYGVSFCDTTNGLAVGRSGSILKTTNGGLTWNQQKSGTIADLRGVCFLNFNTAIIMSEYGLLRTKDGGKTWATQYVGVNKKLNAESFIDLNTGWIVGQDGLIMKTTTGGGDFSGPDSVSVTFRVDMNEYKKLGYFDESKNKVLWYDWLMEDNDHDLIYELRIRLAANRTYNYYFSIDTRTTAFYGRENMGWRSFTTGISDVVLPKVYFNDIDPSKQYFIINATPNPQEGCKALSGWGPYNSQDLVVLNAEPIEPVKFVNWTENDSVISTSPTISFYATSNRKLVANFEGGFLYDITKIIVTANASGPLNPPEMGCLAYAYYGFPTLDGKAPNGINDSPSSNQQKSGAIWLIHTGDTRNDPLLSGRSYLTFSDFIYRITNSGDRWSIIGHDDYEIRFTSKGGKAMLWPTTTYGKTGGKIVDIPFELWNVGTKSDASDDIRYFAYINDVNNNGVFDLSGVDHAISGSSNDPETDWFYWVVPKDKTPGQAGYNAIVAQGNSHTYLDATTTQGTDAFRRMVFVGWNLCDVTNLSSLSSEKKLPENGTIFKIVTWRTETTPIRNEIKEIPSEFSLSQNYPNPFNPSTTISYKVQAASHVTLKVYDLLGREVATLVNEYKQPGTYEIEFVSSHLERSREIPSGVYFYTLRAGEFVQTKKMILMK